LKGKDIPLGARIISVSDCFDALTSRRPYRGPLEVERAVAEIRRNSGKQFDPDCVEAMLRVLRRQGSLPSLELATGVPAMSPEPAV
jgi:HD-GYP domain-containing protein (c-di-GMP phosphodiesterase class II)